MQLRLMRLFRRVPQTQVSLAWLKVAGWLGAHLTGSVPQAPRKRHIEAVAVATDQLGPQPLADEYGEPGGERTPAVVRSLNAVTSRQVIHPFLPTTLNKIVLRFLA